MLATVSAGGVGGSHRGHQNCYYQKHIKIRIVQEHVLCAPETKIIKPNTL